MKHFYTKIILSSFALLVFTTVGDYARANAGLVPPSITVSGIDPATGKILTAAGQTTRVVNVTWNAGTDYAYCEIYYTVDGKNQTELGRDHDGVKPLTVTAGSTYEIWMVVYPGGGQFLIVTRLNVEAKQGNVPAPPPPPPPAGGGIVTGVEDPIGAVTALAIRNVRVESGQNHFIIRFHGPPNQMPYVAVGRAAPITKNGELVFGDNLVGGGFIGLGTVTDAEKARGEYMFASAHGTTFTEDGLEPGRTYHYLINIPAGRGRRPHQDTGKFTMEIEVTTVRVVFERVLILDDSDDLSTAELYMWFWANFGQPGAKFADYVNRDADSGRAYDIGKSVVIENAPNFLSLSASGQDDDSSPATLNFKGFVEEGNAVPFSGPVNRTNLDGNVAKDDFDLTQSPGTNVTKLFVLNSMPGGSLKFTVFGRLEITRRSGGQPGTTGSPLKTDREPIKAQGRIILPEGTPPSTLISICESARRARALNNPAAPGLEEKCRAAGAAGEIAPIKAQGKIIPPEGTPPNPRRPICESARLARERNIAAAPGLTQKCELAIKGASIAAASQDDIDLAAARDAEADELYLEGFDIATAIFGNRALGAQGNTQTGTGSLGIRSTLNAAGQRGFDAAVKLHLSRKYPR